MKPTETIEQLALRVAEKAFGEDFHFMPNEPFVAFANLLRTELAKQQEPVAYIEGNPEGLWFVAYSKNDKAPQKPLYLHPSTPQPAAVPDGWEIDTSTGTEILTYQKCSVIEGEQAKLVYGLLSAAPVPFDQFSHPVKMVPPSQEAKDAELLDWLEGEIKRQNIRGVSFDFTKYAEEGQVLDRGYRMMTRHNLRPRFKSLRESLRAAMCASKEEN